MYVRQSFPISREKIVGSEGYLNAIPSNIERKVGVNWHASTGPLHYIKSIDVTILREMLGNDVYSLNLGTDDIFQPLPPDGWKENFYLTACQMTISVGVGKTGFGMTQSYLYTSKIGTNYHTYWRSYDLP
jgi:hypothetical protein